MESFWKDLRQALRMFRRSPGFSGTALLALALGIGANTAIFSVVNTVLLKPVTAPDPDRVVVFVTTNKEGGGAFASDIKFNLWRRQTNVFDNVSGSHWASFTLTGTDRPVRVDAQCVTAGYFALFGLPVVQGRGFLDGEEQPNGPRAAVLSHAFWKKALNGDPGIVGNPFR